MAESATRGAPSDAKKNVDARSLAHFDKTFFVVPLLTPIPLSSHRFNLSILSQGLGSDADRLKW